MDSIGVPTHRPLLLLSDRSIIIIYCWNIDEPNESLDSRNTMQISGRQSSPSLWELYKCVFSGFINGSNDVIGLEMSCVAAVSANISADNKPNISVCNVLRIIIMNFIDYLFCLSLYLYMYWRSQSSRIWIPLLIKSNLVRFHSEGGGWYEEVQ